MWGSHKGTNAYITNPAGRLYESNSIQINLPVKSLSPAVVNLDCTSEKIAWPRMLNSGNNTTMFVCKLLSVADYSGISVDITWIAIGTWK